MLLVWLRETTYFPQARSEPLVAGYIVRCNEHAISNNVDIVVGSSDVRGSGALLTFEVQGTAENIDEAVVTGGEPPCNWPKKKGFTGGYNPRGVISLHL